MRRIARRKHSPSRTLPPPGWRPRPLPPPEWLPAGLSQEVFHAGGGDFLEENDYLPLGQLPSSQPWREPEHVQALLRLLEAEAELLGLP